jgi:hypothetical protein
MTRTWTLIPAALLFAALSAGCPSQDDPPPPDLENLQGTWAACQTTYYGDLKEALTFGTGTWSGVDTFHSSYDGSCSGSVVDSASMGGTFVVGTTVSAPLGTGTVTAHTADILFTYPVSTTLYTLLYVDVAPAPDVLYIGNTSGAYDGTTAAKRPVAMESRLPYKKQ